MNKDIVFLVADKDMEQTIKGLLTRTRSLGIRQITCDIYIHPQHDSGCCNAAPQFLRSFINQYYYSVVLFDHEGCGKETILASELEKELENELHRTGWNERTRVIIVQPELEIWVWSDSPKVDEAMGWANQQPDLRTWLREEGLLATDQLKPQNPKSAFDAALRAAQKPHSSAIFHQLARGISLTRCTDASFARLKQTLREWFAEV